MVRVGIVGVSGYSGMELAKIVARHPEFVLSLVTSDRWSGRRLGDVLPLSGSAADAVCCPQDQSLDQAKGLDLVFLCTPTEASLSLVPQWLDAGVRVVDLSGGFRLPAADYPLWYGLTHPHAGLLADACYAIPEATDVSQVSKARLVANPGCYPTASVLAVLPFLQAGLVDPSSLIVDAKSGTTGAGRSATEALSFSETAQDFRAYRVLKHQHTPEIERALGLAGFPGHRVTFTAHLLPVRRGILVTAYARLRSGGPKELEQALARFAEGRPFVRVVAPEEVTLRAAVGTNRAVLGARLDAERGIVVALCAIDNLVKGAAGQAVQNANLMFGLPETTGLLDLPTHF
jgi:N-acetyl-gamma-glutamyl-phosphate reductase